MAPRASGPATMRSICDTPGSRANPPGSTATTIVAALMWPRATWLAPSMAWTPRSTRRSPPPITVPAGETFGGAGSARRCRSGRTSQGLLVSHRGGLTHLLGVALPQKGGACQRRRLSLRGLARGRAHDARRHSFVMGPAWFRFPSPSRVPALLAALPGGAPSGRCRFVGTPHARNRETAVRAVGRDRNSGWNCVATNQGWSASSTISTRRPFGDTPAEHHPGFAERFAYSLLNSKPMTVALVHDLFAISLVRERTGTSLHGYRPRRIEAPIWSTFLCSGMRSITGVEVKAATQSSLRPGRQEPRARSR